MAIDLRKLYPELAVATIASSATTPTAACSSITPTRTVSISPDVGDQRAETDYTYAYATLPTGQRTHISYFGTSRLLTPDHFDFSGDTHRPSSISACPASTALMDGPWAGDANGWVATLKRRGPPAS